MPKIDKKTVKLPSKSKQKTAKKLTVLPKNALLKKPRSVRSKENTLAYYNCLLDQVANNDKVKITKLCN